MSTSSPAHTRSCQDVLADQYLVMGRGEIIARGRGVNMEDHGVREMMSI